MKYGMIIRYFILLLFVISLTTVSSYNISNITDNIAENDTVENLSDNITMEKLDKSKPIYFAMDHANANDEQICDNIVKRLEDEGFNVVSKKIGPSTIYEDVRYIYDNNISNVIIFHLFNGVDPSTIRELAVNGDDNRGRIVRSNNNDVVLAWFYDSVDCVNPDGTGYEYVHGSETGASLNNPKQYMDENKIHYICTSSDMGKHKETADYDGIKTVEEFIKLFNNNNNKTDTKMDYISSQKTRDLFQL